MLKFIFLIGLISIPDALISQEPSFNWVKTIGGTSSSFPACTKLDKKNNIYTTGGFSGIPDFDPGADTAYLRCAASNGTGDVFISKLDAQGNYVWARSIGGITSDVGNSLAIDSTENVYIVGTFEGTVDFNPDSSIYNLTSAGGKDFFILKLNKKGSFVWAKRIGYLLDDNANGVEVDQSNNLYITGFYNGTVDFDPGNSVSNLVSSGRSSYVLKLNSNGNYIWAKSLGSGKGDFGIDISLDDSCNVYTTGSYASSGDFDPGNGVYILNNRGTLDAYISKLDSSGNFIWAKGFGGTTADNGRALKIDLAGNIYNTGYFNGTADFDPGASTYNLTSFGLFDTYILKLNSNGNFIWAKSFGGSSDDKVADMDIDRSSDIYLIGSFIGKVDFNPGKDTFTKVYNGGSDIFISKLDSSGIFKWARTIGGSTSDGGSSILLDTNRNILTSGSFSSTVDFNQNGGVYNIIAKGTSDIFIHKMKQGVCYETFSVQILKACKKYTSPSGKYVWTLTNTYKDTIANYMGCDSIITFKLTIAEPSSYSIVLKVCDSINFNGISYTKNGVYNQILMNRAGCDSTLSLDLTFRKSSSNILNYESCDSFIFNKISYKQSGVFKQTSKNRVGCDSVLTLNLVIAKSSFSSTNLYACKRSILNGQTYTKSGVYFQNLKNAAGCDSALKINLKIDTLNGTVSQIGKSLMAKDSGIIYQWIDCNNKKLVFGETNRIFTPMISGNFAAVLNNGICSDTSNCIQFSTSNVNDFYYNGVSIYPNPSNGLFNLNLLNTPGNTRIEIYSNLGKLIIKADVIDNENTVDLTKFSKGLYVVKIINNSNMVSRIIEIQ